MRPKRLRFVSEAGIAAVYISPGVFLFSRVRSSSAPCVSLRAVLVLILLRFWRFRLLSRRPGFVVGFGGSACEAVPLVRVAGPRLVLVLWRRAFVFFVVLSARRFRAMYPCASPKRNELRQCATRVRRHTVTNACRICARLYRIALRPHR